MKTKKQMAITLAAIGLLAFGVTGAHAQIITWSAAQLVDPTSEANISTSGTELDGIQAYGGGGTGYPGAASVLTLADGVAFNAGFTSGGGTVVSDTSGGIVITNAGDGNASALYGSGVTFTDTNYESLLYGGNLVIGAGTIAFNNLTSGDVYQVEVWNSGYTSQPSWQLTLAGTTPVTLQDWNAVTNEGQLAIGTFTASGTSMVEDFNGINISAVQIRDLGPEEAPEPSTVALVGLGALGLAFLIRRHRTV